MKRASLFWTIVTWIDVCFWLGLVILPAVALGLAGSLARERTRRWASRAVAAAFRTVVRCHPVYRLSISGADNIPNGPVVLCANHQSLSDVVFLFSLPRNIRWIIKKELFWVPFFGAAMRSAGYLKIDRGNVASARRLAGQVRQSLADGVTILSFPEGTRSSDGEVGQFSSGAARMAVDSQVPLVPVGVAGTDWVLPKGSGFYPARAHVAIHVGPALTTAGLGRRDIRRLTESLRDGVVAAKSEAESCLPASQKK